MKTRCLQVAASVDRLERPPWRPLASGGSPMRGSFVFGTVAAAVMLGAGGVQASSIFVGTVAAWAANPTVVAADKTFVYLS
ncbi:MAG: hypothetical protein ACK55I_10895 [bacterium]